MQQFKCINYVPVYTRIPTDVFVTISAVKDYGMTGVAAAVAAKVNRGASLNSISILDEDTIISALAQSYILCILYPVMYTCINNIYEASVCTFISFVTIDYTYIHVDTWCTCSTNKA